MESEAQTIFKTKKASSFDEAFPFFPFAARRAADSRGRLSYINLRYTLKELPQPQVLFTLGFSNLKPAPSSVST